MEKREIYLLNSKTEQFTAIDLSELKDGDVFAIYETDGGFIGLFKAHGNPYQIADGSWAIENTTYFDH